MKKLTINPFRYGNSVSGRSYIPPIQAITRVCSRIYNGESSFIIGLTKSGKSSLLSNIPHYYLKLRGRQKNKIIFIPLDAQGNPKWSIDDFWQIMLSQASNELSIDLISELERLRRQNFSGNSISELFRRLNLSPNGNKLVLLVDEFESFVFDSYMNMPHFWGSLRMLSKHGLVVVGASRCTGAELDQRTANIQIGSPYFNHYIDIYLPILTEREIEDFLQTLLQKTEASWKAEVLLFVKNFSGGLPFLVQASAGAFFDCSIEATRNINDIELDAKKLVLRSVHGYFIELWSQLRPEEKLALATVALAQILMDSSLVKADFGFLTHSILSRICHHGLLTSSHDESAKYSGLLVDGRIYAIRSRALLIWIGASLNFVQNNKNAIRGLFFENDKSKSNEICSWFMKTLSRVDLSTYAEYCGIFPETDQKNIAKNKNPIRVFYSYSQKDEQFRNALEAHLISLQRQGLIESWDKHQIAAGEVWQPFAERKLAEAELVLMLISSDFLASDYIYNAELSIMLDRQAMGLVRIVPICVRPVDISGSKLASLKALPSNGQPVSIWPNQDEAWLDVAHGIRTIVLTMR